MIGRRALRRGAAGAGAAVLATIAYLWFVLLSPYGYEAPAGLAPVAGNRLHRVFAYGTLRYEPVRWLVIGRAAPAEAAALPGFRADGLDVVRAPTARTDGIVFEVTADELSALDRYERLGVRYERIELPLDDGTAAWVYRRLPRRAVRPVVPVIDGTERTP